jgi:farnesyl-diphosphate farnesyltransferase
MRRTGVNKLLRDHARTFALTLRLLPRSMREPLGIAYLLARASDTVADAAGIPREYRLALLEELEALLDAGDPRPWNPGAGLKGMVSTTEMELLDSLPAILATLESVADGDVILFLWRIILEGQLFDIRRFHPGAGPLTAGELEFYCGLVAGVVGTTWTLLIAKHAPQALLLPQSDMQKLAMDYGKGLQLVNILRDRAEDRALGRRYVEDSDLPAMLDLARKWLRAGNLYLSGLRPGRILMASALPLDLAVMTLSEVKRFPDKARVRIPRREVRSVLFKGFAYLGLPRPFNPAS